MAQGKTPGLRKRGGIWHIQKSIKGYGILHESTGTSNQAEAARILAKRIEEIRKIVVHGERPTVAFRQAAEKFLDENSHLRSLERYALSFDTLLPYIGDLPLEHVHNDKLSGFRAARREQGITPATVNRDLAAVRRVLNLAARVWRHDNGMPYLDTAPLLTMQPGGGREPYPLQWDEQKRLLEVMPPHLQDMTLFMLNTGLRDQELCNLRWDWEVDVPELGQSIFLLPAEYAKNGEQRVILLNRVAREVIDRQRKKHPERVFTYKGRPMSRMLNSAWKRARNSAGLPQLRVHDLRHTFGHRLRAAGVRLEDRKVLLGHTIGDITTHYCAPELEPLQEFVERIVDERRGTVLRIGPRRADENLGQNRGNGSSEIREAFVSY